MGVRYEATGPASRGSTRTGRGSPRAWTARCPDRFNVLVARRGPERARVFVLGYAIRARTTCSTPSKRKLEHPGRRRVARIKPDAMPSRKLVRYPARDGLSIPGVADAARRIAEAKDLPLVV